MIFHSFDVTVDFNEGTDFNCLFGNEGQFEVEFGYTPPTDAYEGTYEVTPTDYEQYLYTANKLLENNVTVHKTPYSEVSNVSGGYTATIL